MWTPDLKTHITPSCPDTRMWFEAMWWGSLKLFSDADSKGMWKESHQIVINDISDIPSSTGGDTRSAQLCNHPLWTAALPLWNLRRNAGDIDSCWRPDMKIRSEQRDKTDVLFYSSTSTQPKRNDAIVPEAKRNDVIWCSCRTSSCLLDTPGNDAPVMTQLQDEKRENSKRTCTEQDGDKRL